jgi:predicted nucleic acid-binding protein
LTVLVDTTIWSLALRRRARDLSPIEHALVAEWERLVRGGAAALVGPIRQEILSGIRDPKAFRALQEQLSAFRYLEIQPVDYDRAAIGFSACRARGITGGGVDFLICAVAERLRVAIFTTDPDFDAYAEHLPIRLHVPRPLERDDRPASAD